MRITVINWRLLAACAAAGLAGGAAVSFTIHDRYISAATLRLHAGTQSDLVALQKVQLSIRNVLSRTSLSNVIQSPGLDLYKQERTRKPLEDVIGDMKAHDLKVVLSSPARTVRIVYRGESPLQAQAAVRLLTTRIRDEYLNRQQTAKLSTDIGIQVLDPPSLDTSPIYPNRPIVAVVGLFGGLLTAFVVLLVRRAARAWLISALLILLVDGATNFLPLPYESRATMMFDSPATVQAVVTDRALALAGLESQSWRGIDLSPEQSGPGLVVRVRNADRFVAQRTAQAAVIRFMNRVASKRQGFSSAAEVLEPPSLPVWPMGEAWRDALAAASFALALISGGILLLQRRTEHLRSQPGYRRNAQLRLPMFPLLLVRLLCAASLSADWLFTSFRGNSETGTPRGADARSLAGPGIRRRLAHAVDKGPAPRPVRATASWSLQLP